MDFSMIINASLGGVLTGVSAIIICLFQKRMENKADKYSMSNILHIEIKRMVGVERLNQRANYGTMPSQHAPGMEIYHGLLISCNIKHFDNNLQEKLDKLYGYFKEAPLNPDVNLGTDIMSELEEIKRNNRRYRDLVTSA